MTRYNIWQTVWKSLKDIHQPGFEESAPDRRVLIGEHDHLVDAISQGDPAAADDAARCHIEASWSRKMKHARGAPTNASGSFHRVATHLSANLHCRVRLEKVAREVAFVSPRSLSRLFLQHCGLGFQCYLQALRMQKAAELLCTTRLPVATIARRVGYRDVSRFGEHFKCQFDAQPSQCRSSNTHTRVSVRQTTS